MTLYEMTAAATQLYEMLQADEIDETALNDTLEAMGAEEKLENYVYVMKNIEAEISLYKAEADRIDEKLKKAQKNADRMKTAVLGYMQAAGLKKAKAGTFDLTVRTSERVDSTDEKSRPQEYLKPQPPKVDKTAIKAAIKSGVSVSGAEIVKNESVTVK